MTLKLKFLLKSLNRYYSTKVIPTDTSQKNIKLNPDFVSGFIDGEGSFSVTFIKDKSYKSGWQIKSSFSIGLHQKDLAILEKIKLFFGVGGISQKGVNGVQYYVNSPKDLLIIENHLKKYPLLTKKQADFILFKNTVYVIDFGLSQISIKPEDHAVDLRLIKEILNSAHAKIMMSSWKNFLNGYKSIVGYAYYAQITKLVSDIESRGRYAQVVWSIFCFLK